MAKYTETLQDYIEDGGTLPSSAFALVDDFEELFVAKYADCEIGFETPYLFEVKLSAKAKHVMPLYADKIAIMKGQIDAIKENASKVSEETRVYGATHVGTHNDGKASDMPYDGVNPQPSNVSETDGTADADEHTDTFTKDYGLAPVERETILAIARKVKDLEEDCLKEFKDLFMGVY